MDAPSSTDRSRARLARRAFLGLGPLAAVPARAAAQLRTPGPPAPTVLGDVQVKLARRVTNGATPADIQEVYNLGYDAYLAQQLDPASIDDAACDARMALLTTINVPTPQLYARDGNTIIREIGDSMILRSIYSRRQLFERTVEFWTDHFHTNLNTVGLYKTAEVRDVYRKYAFATFKEMLYASATSPAMLAYLNGAQNTRTAPNQNYGREVMELHTLGVDGGYTQQDVIDIARCLTGWRIIGTTGDPNRGTAFFDNNRHDNTAKTFLGVPIAANGGQADTYKVLDILLAHPSTAKRIATKLLRWFLDYDPSAALVADVAEVFRQKGGNIKDLLRRILASDNVLAAAPLFKRPYHYIVSAVRVLGINVTAIDSIRNAYIPSVGQTPFQWGPPNGYPQDYGYWGTLPLTRWNFVFSLANGSVSGATFDLTALLAGATTSTAVADRFDRLVFAGEMPRADKAALVTYLNPTPPTTARIRDALGLALASPAFQWH